MNNEKIEIGKLYGNLKVLSFTKRQSCHNYFNCECQKCKDIIEVRDDNIIKYGSSSKCTCSKNKSIIVGNTYGNLLVLSNEPDKIKSNGMREKWYTCKCTKCDAIVSLRSDSVKLGKTSKCNCALSKQIEIGKIYGNLEVIKTDFKMTNKTGRLHYECKCTKCGDIVSVRYDNIFIYGRSSKCHCIIEKPKEIVDDLFGRKFGKLTVIDHGTINRNDHKSYWKVRCECGEEFIVTRGNLVSGGTTQCQKCSYKNRGYNNIKIMTGLQFGKLHVLGMSDVRSYSEVCWVCQCECGNIRIVPGSELRSGKITSCVDCTRKTHGMSDTNFYKVWSNMKSRCNNPNDRRYKNYGGRGIFVCKEWNDSFSNFYDDMYDTYQEGLMLDRIDNNDGYYKDNCRWVTPSDNLYNRRNTFKVNYEGEELTIHELKEKYGYYVPELNEDKIYGRIKNNMSVKEALMLQLYLPPREREKQLNKINNLIKPIKFVNKDKNKEDNDKDKNK